MPLGFQERVRLSEAAATQLLLDLCVKFGFCLPPRQQSRLRKNPPANIERFARTVYFVEGLDPDLESDLYKAVQAYIGLAFEHQLSQDANSKAE